MGSKPKNSTAYDNYGDSVCDTQQTHNPKSNLAYIVAACNAMPRLIDMIEYLAGRLCDEDHGDNDFDGKIQDAFEMTEPIK